MTDGHPSSGPGRLSRRPGPALHPDVNRPRLLCLPGAGASAARFEQLRRHLADTVELRTFELPSRGIRFAEPPLTSLSDHVAHFVRHIEAEPYQRWVLLGESLGAVTAASVAAELADSMRAEVVGLITVSAAPGSTGRRSRDEVLAQLEADARGTATGELITLAAEAILVDIDAAHAAAEVTDVPAVGVPLATIRGRADSLVTERGPAGGRPWPGPACGTGRLAATTSSSSAPPGSCSRPCGTPSGSCRAAQRRPSAGRRDVCRPHYPGWP